MSTSHQVTIYSTPTCHYCDLAKAYFKEHNVQYTEYNVASDFEKRAEMIDITGQMGVPVIAIDDAYIVGFNREAVEKLLAQPVEAKVVAMNTDRSDMAMGQAA